VADESKTAAQKAAEKQQQERQAEQQKKAADSGDAVTAEQSKVAPKSASGKQSVSGADLDRQRRLGLSTGGTTEAGAEQYDKLGVNPRLDNRLGDQRPPLEEYPAKPQQVPGPEVGHFAEHAEQQRELFSKFSGDDVERLGGVRQEGRHGLGERGVDETKLDEESDH
jgi:hypothetical protein